MAVNPFAMSFADDDDSTSMSMFNAEELNDEVNTTPTRSTASETPSVADVTTNPAPAKYNIVDFYWFVRQEALENKPLPQDECGMIIVGYNSSFANLRVTFYDVGSGNIKPGEIHKDEMKMIATINIFSETAMQILAAIGSKKTATINNYERMFKFNTSWHPTLAKFDIDVPKGTITITIRVGDNGKRVFHLTDWQVTAFMDSLKFMTNGRSWIASLATPK